jgi:hypothetical protein
MSFETLMSFVITLAVFSYLLGDNLLYRLAVYAFVGITAAFTAIALAENVVANYLSNTGDTILLVVAFVMAVLLTFKAVPVISGLGNLSLAFLIAVGTAVAVTGAVAGTLIPLIGSIARPQSGDTLNSIILVVGVICTLMYFQYSARRTRTGGIERGPISRVVAGVGEVFIAGMLGATYGAIIVSTLSVLTGHLSKLLGS